MHQFVQIVQWINTFIIFTELLIVARNMKNRIHSFLYMTCVSMLVSSISYLINLYCTTDEGFYITLLICWGGKIFSLLAAFHLCACLCRFTIPRWISNIQIVFVVLTAAVITSTRQTGLFYSAPRLEREGEWTVLQFTRGPWLVLWDIFALAVILSCMVMVFRSISGENQEQQKKRNIMVLIALSVELFIVFFTFIIDSSNSFFS